MSRAPTIRRQSPVRWAARQRRRTAPFRKDSEIGSTLAAAAAFAPVDQHYLLQARQMQALSFAVHIPLVAFGISFPAMVLFVEWLGHRRGDELYLTLAQRWSKVMLAL